MSEEKTELENLKSLFTTAKRELDDMEKEDTELRNKYLKFSEIRENQIKSLFSKYVEDFRYLNEERFGSIFNDPKINIVYNKETWKYSNDLRYLLLQENKVPINI